MAEVEDHVSEIQPVSTVPDLAEWWVSIVENTDIFYMKHEETFDKLETSLKCICVEFPRKFTQYLKLLASRISPTGIRTVCVEDEVGRNA